MKTKITLLLAVAMSASVVTQLASASVIHQIVLTESSSTSLTATYDGSTTGVTVTFNSSDNWTVNFPTTVNFGSTGRNVDWIEPENSSLGNAVSFFPEVSSVLGVSSDVVTTFPPVANDSTVVNVGSDSRGGSISATFFDNAATAEHPAVPDTDSTFCLLFLSLMGLLGASRFRLA